jgi:hypothetical protein
LVFIARGVRRRESDVDGPYRDGHVWSPDAATQDPAAEDSGTEAVEEKEEHT